MKGAKRHVAAVYSIGKKTALSSQRHYSIMYPPVWILRYYIGLCIYFEVWLCCELNCTGKPLLLGRWAGCSVKRLDITPPSSLSRRTAFSLSLSRGTGDFPSLVLAYRKGWVQWWDRRRVWLDSDKKTGARRRPLSSMRSCSTAAPHSSSS